jgi:hypothetical protein
LFLVLLHSFSVAWDVCNSRTLGFKVILSSRLRRRELGPTNEKRFQLE